MSYFVVSPDDNHHETDDMIFNFGSVHCFHVLIIFAKLFVLIWHICLHIPLYHLI